MKWLMALFICNMSWAETSQTLSLSAKVPLTVSVNKERKVSSNNPSQIEVNEITNQKTNSKTKIIVVK